MNKNVWLYQRYFAFFVVQKRSDVKLFRNETLVSCEEILRIQKESHSEFSDIVLPSQVDKLHGFHFECYNDFIAERQNIDVELRQMKHQHPLKRTAIPNNYNRIVRSADFFM